jgi:hypothetical protein
VLDLGLQGPGEPVEQVDSAFAGRACDGRHALHESAPIFAVGTEGHLDFVGAKWTLSPAELISGAQGAPIKTSDRPGLQKSVQRTSARLGGPERLLDALLKVYELNEMASK